MLCWATPGVCLRGVRQMDGTAWRVGKRPIGSLETVCGLKRCSSAADWLSCCLLLVLLDVVAMAPVAAEQRRFQVAVRGSDACSPAESSVDEQVT